jgi:hypothetical protein
MADKKISQLSNASTPLAGTEVLPIVQSSTTVKVATDNLTVKNVRSNATSGILQIAGPAAAATRTMTVPDANFTVARTDAANSFTGDQTLSNGNLVVGTAGKGIDFSANPNAGGMTSELLTAYEEGTWTVNFYDAASGGNASSTTATGYYTRVGNRVTCNFGVGSISTAGMTPANSFYFSLPFTSKATSGFGAGTAALEQMTLDAGRTWVIPYIQANATRGIFRMSGSAVDCTSLQVQDLVSGTSAIENLTVVYSI